MDAGQGAAELRETCTLIQPHHHPEMLFNASCQAVKLIAAFEG
jgi:hypothetical protein